MRRNIHITYILPVILLIACCRSPGRESGTAERTSEAQKTDWQWLFDGESTEHWRGYNMEDFPAGGWSVEDGLLIVEYSGNEEEGYGGSIITREKYKDFELELEYLLTDTANSGIFYLVLEREGQVIWNNAPEFQLIDDAVYEALLGEDWMNTHRTGDNYDLHMADSNYSRPVGEWNSARILKRGNHIEHWVNGHKTVEYELGSAEWRALVEKSKFAEFPEYGTAVEGHIGLQDHGHRVAFRDIRVRRL